MGALRGVWVRAASLEIGRNRPKIALFQCRDLGRPFPEGARESPWETQKNGVKIGLFPQIFSDFLKPPSLKPPFLAALQNVNATLCNFETQTFRALLKLSRQKSRDIPPKSACFPWASKDVPNCLAPTRSRGMFRHFLPRILDQKRSHHVMDALFCPDHFGTVTKTFWGDPAILQFQRPTYVN